MKVKSGKIIKICALSLSFLLVGGIATSLSAKTYAQELAQSPSQENRIIRVHFNVANKGYKVHVWYDDVTGITRSFDGTDEYGSYIDIKVEKNKPTLYFIIAVINGNNWGDREYKGNQDGKRTLDLTNSNTSEIWIESGVEGHKVENPLKPQDGTSTDWAKKIEDLINKIDDLKISANDKAKLAIELYGIKDGEGKRTEEDYKKAEAIFNKKAKEAEEKNPDGSVVQTSKAPTVERITKSSTKIKGTGVKGAKIEIYYGHSENDLTLVRTGEIIVDEDGNWSVEKPNYIGIHGGEIISVSQTEKGKKPNQTKAEIEEIKTSDFIKRKIPNIKAKDIKVWKGDKIDWIEVYEIYGQANDDEYKFINDELKLALKRDLDNRTSKEDGKYDGKIEFTFRDKSKLELANTLYVSNPVVGANDGNVPEDAILVKMMLGEGVEVELSDKTKKVGDKDNPVLYQDYKVKPNTDINKYEFGILKNSIVKAVPLKFKKGYQNPKFKDANGGEDFVVTAQNNIFIASAEKKPDNNPQNPTTPDSSKKPSTPNEKPGNSGLLDAKSEKKAKPSEKEVSSYNKLRIARDKNVVSVKAAKLLLEIAPERVKNVKSELMKLITKSEGLVKQADIILEKLEAKYEF